MFSNNVSISFDVDKIITHENDEFGNPLPNGPLLVVDNAGNIVRID